MLKNGVEYSENEIKTLKNYVLKKKDIDEFLEKGEISTNIFKLEELNEFFSNQIWKAPNKLERANYRPGLLPNSPGRKQFISLF